LANSYFSRGEFFPKTAKFTVNPIFREKFFPALEGFPKKAVFPSHGDFRQYLYEAPIFTIPSSKGKAK